MPLTSEKKNIGLMKRNATFDATSFNEDDYTIDVVFATEHPVLSYDWEIGRFYEILSMDKSHIRTQRLDSGSVPVLRDHKSGHENHIGTVVSHKFSNGEARATIKFSKRESLKEYINDIKSGIIRNTSVGYQVYKYEDLSEDNDKYPTLRAIDWEAFEVTFTSIPADYNAGTRSADDKLNEVEIVKKNRTMPNLNTDPEDPKPNEPIANPTANPEVQSDAVRKAAEDGMIQERKRVSEISDATRAFNLPDTFKQDCIDKGYSIEKVRELAQIEFSKADPNKGASARVSVGEDETVKERSGIIASLVIRSAQIDSKHITEKDRELSRNFRGMSLLDLAKHCLRAAGEKFNDYDDKMTLVGRAITSHSSDFPVLLEGANRRVLLASYTAIADVWREFCSVGSLSDFREHKLLRMGSFSNLDSVDENQEYKTKKITDADHEKASLGTKGNIINVSRKMIVNDDLQGFLKLAKMLGRAAARSIETDVFDLLAANPALVDGTELFHANHNNLIASGAISVDGFDAIRVAMGSQKDKDDNDFVASLPYVLLCSLSNGGSARVINQAQYDPDASNKYAKPNKSAGLFTKIVDTPRLAASVMYAFANPAEEPVIEVDFLDGVQTPVLESQESFNVDGMQWKIRLDYGVNAVGFRGAQKIVL